MTAAAAPARYLSVARHLATSDYYHSEIFTRDLEAAYRATWRRWLDRASRM